MNRVPASATKSNRIPACGHGETDEGERRTTSGGDCGRVSDEPVQSPLCRMPRLATGVSRTLQCLTWRAHRRRFPLVTGIVPFVVVAERGVRLPFEDVRCTAPASFDAGLAPGRHLQGHPQFSATEPARRRHRWARSTQTGERSSDDGNHSTMSTGAGPPGGLAPDGSRTRRGGERPRRRYRRARECRGCAAQMAGQLPVRGARALVG